VTSYPALADEGDSVAVRTFDTPQGQRAAMWRGTRRLLLLGAPSPVKFVLARLDNADKLVLSANPYRDMPELFDDCFACAVDKIMADGGGPAWDEPAFTRLADRVRAEFNETATEVVLRLRRILAAANSVRTRLSNMDSKPLAPALSDASAQLSALVYRGFVSETGFARLPDVARYLLAIERRLEKLPQRPDRDLEWTSQIAAVEEEYRELAGSLPASDDLATVRWMIEELRVSLFAQTVKTAYPISAKRIYKELDRIADRA